MRRKKNESEDELDRDLLNHIRGLGLDSVESYRDWCAKNGFSKRLNKHWSETPQSKAAIPYLRMRRAFSCIGEDYLRESA